MGQDAPGIDDGNAPHDWKYYPYTGFPLISSLEALDIDKKLDDGMPGLGKIHTRRGKKNWKQWDEYTCTNDIPTFVSGSEEATLQSQSAAKTAKYDVGLKGTQCYLLFEINFPI